MKALFDRRSVGLGLVGKHIDTTSGAWTEAESGIGYEYIITIYLFKTRAVCARVMLRDSQNTPCY